MHDIDSRIQRVASRALRKRLILFAVLWLGLPLLAALFVYVVGATESLLIYAPVIAAWWTVYYSGQSWKERSRVQALLEESESPIVVFPVRRPHAPVLWRTVRGCFLVLTERRVLAFTYNKLLDAPTSVLWVADRSESVAQLRADGRLLTVTSQGTEMAFGVAERRRKATAHFVSALGV
ncbi:hypothetical protein ACFYO0_24205 [Streptomyces sp. NPDC006365]|uniref:hypothetical protein n=1 Tax=Streptomyces sp. NPDC006365 TaxID=3364744 RepID=UPI00367D0895